MTKFATEQRLGKIMRTLSFSAAKHRDQRRKDVQASPYINHPIALAAILADEVGIVDTSVICAALVPVLTSTKVVCQPSPPAATCAMLPPPVPTLANAGIVVSALLGGEKRSPSTLIWPPAGVSNSMVPRLLAVSGNPFVGSDSTKDV